MRPPRLKPGVSLAGQTNMPTLSQNLLLPRCPHCSIANPNLFSQHNLETNDHQRTHKRSWRVYTCGSCGGLVTAWSEAYDQPVRGYYPEQRAVDELIPERPRTFLQQALESLHAPSGAVMLAASAVDAMLKLRNYVDGSLYARIEKAASDHVITADMAHWAHEVRLDANDQRHADQAASLPSAADAQRAIDFAMALSELLFVLPARVQRGVADAKTAG